MLFFSSFRSIRREHNSKQKQHKRERKMPSSELPLPQTSTLRSRRRLANMLVAAALIFICCWSPHVICFICSELGRTDADKSIDICPKILSDFFLLLGKFFAAEWLAFFKSIIYFTPHFPLHPRLCTFSAKSDSVLDPKP